MRKPLKGTTVVATLSERTCRNKEGCHGGFGQKTESKMASVISLIHSTSSSQTRNFQSNSATSSACTMAALGRKLQAHRSSRPKACHQGETTVGTEQHQFTLVIKITPLEHNVRTSRDDLWAFLESNGDDRIRKKPKSSRASKTFRIITSNCQVHMGAPKSRDGRNSPLGARYSWKPTWL
ncbi:hypothetical protein RB195_023108 [Necator americanus]|uniref:Uncharacterized protein n=1 Tax=Necator americanus TaxID=51031 RepID=A0ABR1EI25_NECAM